MRGPMLGKVEALAGNRKRQRATNDEGRTILEARGGIEPPIEVLQTSALPLGYRASREKQARNPRPRRGSRYLERETGFEPATSTLARSHSTTELLPLGSSIITKRRMGQQTAATTCETIRRAQFTAEAWRSRRRSGSNATAYRAYGL